MRIAGSTAGWIGFVGLLSACAAGSSLTSLTGDSGIGGPGGGNDGGPHHADSSLGSLDASPAGDAAADVAAGGSDTGSADGGAPAHDGGPTGKDASGVCSDGATQSCATGCGSTGTSTCAAGAWGACAPPAETCNLLDDDCSGYCDDILGCRIGVDRSDDSTTGLHFYTTSDSEASCCGYSVETFDAFYLYGSAQTGVVPFYRCLTSTGSHLYTTDSACEGGTLEGNMGFIATSSVCGSVPLYRLDNATSGDHFYTTSMAEATSAEGAGYTLNGTAGYVWPGDCGGPSCTWPSPIDMVGSTTTAATGFPTVWYGFPIDGAESMTTLSGTVSVTNSANLYSEVLFILQYLPTGTCTSGHLPASTPEYGPPGAQPLANFIVKAPTTGTFSVPINFTLPGGLPMTSCVLMGLNGGTVTTAHDVTAAASLSLSFTAPQTPTQGVLLPGGEFCFGQSSGCQRATTNDAQSFATVTPVTQTTNVVALYGDISDSTFDGTSAFGAPPAGAWTAANDFYVYRGNDCSAFGVASGIAGPGNYYASIPSNAVHLLSVPLSGSGIGVAEKQVFQPITGVSLASGDCLVALWGLSGGGGFDNETQVYVLTSP